MEIFIWVVIIAFLTYILSKDITRQPKSFLLKKGNPNKGNTYYLLKYNGSKSIKDIVGEVCNRSRGSRPNG